jgi:hypothetical protein
MKPKLVASAAPAILLLLSLPAAAATPLADTDFARMAPAGGVLAAPRRDARPATEEADPAGRWKSAGTLSRAVAQTGSAAFVNGHGYVVGGYTRFRPVRLFPYVQVYDGVAWTVDSSEKIPIVDRVGATGWADAAVCADPGGRIHVIDGTDGRFLYAVHMVYDPAAPAGSRWTYDTAPTVNHVMYAAQDAGCAYLDGKLYLFAGYGAIGNAAADFQTITWVYDPDERTWADTGQALHTARVWHGYATSGRAIFVSGGTNDRFYYTPTDSNEAYTPSRGWVELPPLPAAWRGGRLAPGVGVIGDELLVFGGGTGSFRTHWNVERVTLGCALPCTGWTNTRRDLQTPAWYFGWASGDGHVLAAGGQDVDLDILDAAEIGP